MLNIGKEKDLFINEQIRANEVRLVGPKGEALGIKSKKDALILATTAGFDLVLISPNANPPVCKLMDYNKFKYEKQKQQKEFKKKQRKNNLEMKEYRLSANIDIHDFNTRLKNASKYLEKGHKVKVSIRFRGYRELSHSDRGREVMKDFANKLNEIADIESRPKLDGRLMVMILAPKK